MIVGQLFRMRDASPVRPNRIVIVRDVIPPDRVVIAWTSANGETTLTVPRRLIDRHGHPVRRRGDETTQGALC